MGLAMDLFRLHSLKFSFGPKKELMRSKEAKVDSNRETIPDQRQR